MLSRLLPATAVAVVLLAAPAGATTFKVVKATHSSSSSKQADGYQGTSAVSWALAKPGRMAVTTGGGTTTGMGTFGVRGRYAIDASTSWGHCAWTAETGDPEYSAVAPSELTLAFGPDPRTGAGLFATISATDATLSNPYLPSECSTSMSGEPTPQETSAVPVKPAALKRKRLTLRYKGATAREGIDYRWATTIVLERK